MRSIRILYQRFNRELQLYRNILADPRTPRLTKVLLGAAVAYAVSPVDLIPDFIPVIGHLDDAVILPLLICLAFKTVPLSLLKEHRKSMGIPDECGTWLGR